MLLVNAKARPTLGLLISHIDGTYQVRFWQGLLHFCRRHDCDLVVYASRLWRGQAGSFRDQEVVYRLANPRRIDALCIDSSAFRNQDDLDEYLQSSSELSKIPIVYSSIGGADQPRVMPDNRGGIRQAMAHLIDVHGCRRLAYVGGPLDIEDAQQRHAAFLEFAAERGLSTPSDWLLEGTFDTPSGREATFRILESAAGVPDAIVFANDLMALGGLDVLKARGVLVPEQVRVTGFDDVDLSLLSTPTLTTVAQPIEAKAWVVGKALLDAVNGLPLQPPVELGVKFLPRGSCGCTEAQTTVTAAKGNVDKLLFDSKHAITGISQVTEFLGSVLSLPDLSAQLAKLIPVLGMGPTYLSLHDETSDEPPPTKFCHLVSAVGADGTQNVEPARPRRFLSEQIIPSFIQASDVRSELFVQALSKNEKHFGFLTTEYTGADPAVLVSLRDHISEALLNIQHVLELDQSQHALKQALERATESERQFRELAESLPTFVMETGPNGSIQYLNDKAKNLFDVCDDDVALGLNVSDFLDPDLPRDTDSSSIPESSGYQDRRFVSKKGRKVALLMRTAELDGTIRRWNGFDYKPVLESATRPDRQVMEAHGLTRRETQVLALELRGLLAKEIAAELSISLSTVKGHLGLVYRKLGVGSRDQLFTMFGKQIVAEYGFASLVFSLLSEILRQ